MMAAACFYLPQALWARLIAGPFPSTSNPYAKGIRSGGVANYDQSRGSFLNAKNISIKPSNWVEKNTKGNSPLPPTGRG
jgi:hypothetical protein